MATVQQIQLQSLDLLRETDGDSHFTNTQFLSWINQAVRLIAPIIEHPRDIVSVQADSTADGYTLPSDLIVLRTVYFGDRSISNDVRPLVFVTEETLKELYPGWLEQTIVSRGRPRYAMFLDKRTLFVYPRPDADNAVANKSVIIDYIYSPAVLSSNAQEPDLPIPYHDILKFYICSLCYLNLGNPAMAKAMMEKFMEEHKLLESVSTKESKEGLAFQWGYDEDVNDNFSRGGYVIP